MIQTIQVNLKKHAFWIIAICGAFLFYLWGNTRESIWFDESFSAMITRKSFLDIIVFSGLDSHPPLYYLCLKLFRGIFGESLFVMRAFSAMGMAALLSMAAFPLRRLWGVKCAVIFFILLLITPIHLAMAQEIRMYTWASFFVTGSAVYAALVLRDNIKSDWVKLSLLSLGAAYTHYYALLPVFLIWLYLAVFILIKDRSKLLPLLVSGILPVLSYIPWMFFLAKQMSRVSHDYWIPQIDFSTLLGVFIYPFGFKFGSPREIQMIAATVICAAFIWIGLKIKDKSSRLSWICISAYLGTILIAVAVSLNLRPVLVERYIFPSTGLFLLATAWGLSQLDSYPKVRKWIVLLIALSILQFIRIEAWKFNGEAQEAAQYIQKYLKPGDIIVHANEHTPGIFSYYFPRVRQLLYLGDGVRIYSNFKTFNPPVEIVSNWTELTNALQGHSELFLVNMANLEGSRVIPQWLYENKFIIQDNISDSFGNYASFFNIAVSRVTPGYSTNTEKPVQ